MLIPLMFLPVFLIAVLAGRRRSSPAVGHSARAGAAGCLLGLLGLLGVLFFVGVSYKATAVVPMQTTMHTSSSAQPGVRLEVGPSSQMGSKARRTPELSETGAVAIPKAGDTTSGPAAPPANIPVASLAPAPLPEPAIMLRPSVVITTPPAAPAVPPVAAVTSQWWADREQACRQASEQLLKELVRLRSPEEQAFLERRGVLASLGDALVWSGELETMNKDFGNGLKATMYRAHLRQLSEEGFVLRLHAVMQAAALENRVLRAGSVFVGLTAVFAVLGWVLRRPSAP